MGRKRWGNLAFWLGVLGVAAVHFLLCLNLAAAAAIEILFGLFSREPAPERPRASLLRVLLFPLLQLDAAQQLPGWAQVGATVLLSLLWGLGLSTLVRALVRWLRK